MILKKGYGVLPGNKGPGAGVNGVTLLCQLTENSDKCSGILHPLCC